MRERLSLIVFDWDGTLMNSERNIVGSMQRAFAAASLPQPSATAVRQVIGLALDRAVLALLPDGESDRLESIEDAYRTFYRQAGGASPLFDNAMDVLAELKRLDYVLAVATGKSRAGLERAIEQSGLTGTFSATRSADQCASKPAPEMLEQLLFETGFEPGEAIMIGDTTYDLEMASRAGTHAAAACYGAHSTEQLRRCEPAFLLDEISQLPEKLELFESSAR